MKKGLFFYCLLASLVFHLLVVFLVRLDQTRKEKEPIAIDLLGPLTPAQKTRLPRKLAKAGPIPPPSQVAPGGAAERLRAMLPSFPAFPTPAPQGKPQPPVAETLQRPVAAAATAVRPAAVAQPGPGKTEEAQKRLIMPTAEDLMRYAKLDRDVERPKDGETITLDADDLLYTSYLQGIRKRIELVWKYPETARREELQGNLVMKFSIDKSGRVEDIELIKSSGYGMLDDAAKQALLDANPFNPFPEKWNKDRFTITGTFIYRLYGMYLR